MEPRSGFLSSPRRRRRLAWSGGILAFLGGLVAFAALYPDVKREPEQISNEPAVVITTPTDVPLTKDVKAATIATANTFLHTAVARDHPERGWDVVHPSLREGYTKKAWASGDIPIVPYPVDSAIYRLDFSHPGVVGWRVDVFPKPGVATKAMTFYMDVTLSGSGTGRRWRVSNWSPASLSVAEAGPSASAGDGMRMSLGTGADAEYKSRVSPAWLLIPVGLLAAVLLAVTGKGVRDWRRTAAAERLYKSNSNPS